MHLPHASLFRAYDIRGIIEETLSAQDFLAIGHAFASHVADTCQTRTPLLVVMRDGRLSSPNLAEAMIEGMLKAGARVLDAGMGPTPMCYFATHHLAADGSAMITGSHNPPAHNGAKFMCDGQSLYGAPLAALRTRLAEGNLLHSRGIREEVSLLDEYVYALRNVAADANFLDCLPMVWDAGNGAAGNVVEALLKGTKAPHLPLYLTVDGTFPNHHPDPADPHTLASMQAAIADDHEVSRFGVAFDGDGDRMGAVDERGRIVAPDHLLMLLADDVLARNPGALILADVKTSDRFFARVRAGGGQPLMWMTGHAHIKTKMAALGAAFAGEASGHLFFADSYYGYDDGIYAALRLARIVAESGQTLAELVDALPPLHATSEMRIPCADAHKFEIIAAIASDLVASGATVNTLDGVRVSTKEGWWLLRASNTQAVLVARAEAGNPEDLPVLIAAIRSALAPHGLGGLL